jgi:PleD family two-component response regulator
MSDIDTSNSPTPIRILLVDDDPVFAKVVKTVLQLYQGRTFVTTWKDSVESAMAEIEGKSEIDVILTDYYFPSSNGLELCVQLNQTGHSIPIILLTSARDFKLAVEAMKLGVEDFLLKDEIEKARLPRTILNIQAVEKRLAMAENRAQAIRELVVTVCHEFNNPLAAVKISYDLLRRQLQGKAEPKEIKEFEERFESIDSEIRKLRDLNFERIEFEIK